MPISLKTGNHQPFPPGAGDAAKTPVPKPDLRTLPHGPARKGKEGIVLVGQNTDTGFDGEDLKRRRVPDRRRRPTPILSRYSLKGKRKDVRRDEDKRRHIYVDQYSVRFFVLLMAILLLGIADAFLTLHHVHVNNAEELNPIMDYFLGLSPKIFFNVKYVLTALCLTVLCLHKNLPIVKYLLGVVLLIYLVIVVNHLYLFVLVS